jgi:hypothetical protein
MATCKNCLHFNACSKWTDFPEQCGVPVCARFEEKSAWISVDERLPEKGQEVLAYRGDFRGDMMNTYTYLGTGDWEDDYGYRGSAKHEGITHWMPLPEPPITDKPTQE